jgi:CheY-like chemotaxis protein
MSSSEARALICEDDRAIRALLDKLLSRHGLAVESVAAGWEVIDRIRRHHFDVILLDLLMPEMTGFDVLDLISRERPALLDQVIVVTACQSVFNGSLPAPVAAVVRKPFDVADFDDVVSSVLRRPHTFREDLSA